MLSGHVAATAVRCEAEDLVVVAQDSTAFDYTSHAATTGLGPYATDDSARGILCHSALAMSLSGLPLGVVGAKLWTRDPGERGKRADRYTKSTSEKESQKWLEAVAQAESALPGKPIIMVQDREADIYDLLAVPRRETTHLIVRAAHPRRA
jgi:hypothetical protein